MCWLVTIALLVGGADRTESKDAKDRAKLRALMEVNRKAFPKVTEITAEALQAKLNNESVVLVDVRPEAERSISVIPGAISAAEFEENPSKYQGSVVACYCTVGYRSGAYAEKWRKQGTPILNFNGSILAWCQAGGKLQTPTGQPTRRVHVYGRKWNLVPEAYEPVW